MSKEFARKLYVIELRDEKGKWSLTRFGDYYREDHKRMRGELTKARAQYPDCRYKLTTYVPKELVTTRKKKKPTRRKR